MKVRLPGVCIVCRAPLTWNGKQWRSGRRGRGGRHVCPAERQVCGALMPIALERCARRPGHRTEHRTAYALANARRKGLAA